MKNQTIDTRRSFIKKVTVGSVFATFGSASAFSAISDPVLKKKVSNAVSFNLGLQEGVTPGESLEQKLDFLESNGVYGIEVGGGKLPGRVTEFQKALQNRKVKISAICAGFKGWLISSEESERKKCIDSSKDILSSAVSLVAYGMILVPGFN